ncbi:MAG: CHASE2 domain-containing protein [Myxococcota bacterium]
MTTLPGADGPGRDAPAGPASASAASAPSAAGGLLPLGVRLVIVLVAAALAGARLIGLDPFGGVEDRLSDSILLSLAPDPPIDDRIVLIEIDDRSLADLRQRWPLERSTWALFFRRLAEYRPAVVMADVMFDLPGRSDAHELVDDIAARLAASSWSLAPEGRTLTAWLDDVSRKLDADQELAAAIGECGNVTLGMLCTDREPFRDAAYLPPPLPRGDYGLATQAVGVVATHAAIAIAARSHGAMNVVVDDDGTVRRYPYAIGVAGAAWPSLALAAALSDASAAEQAAAVARLASVDGGVPTLRFRTRAQPWRRLSFSDVMLAPYSEGLAQLLAGKVVIVGATAIGVEDLQRTPSAPQVAGLELHATAFENYTHDSWLERGGAAAGLSALLTLALLGVLAWVLGRRPRGRVIVGLSLAVLVAHLVIAVLLAAHGQKLLALMPLPVGLVVLLLAEGIYRWVDGRRERTELMARERVLRAERAALEGFRSVVEHAGDAMVSVDPAERVRWMNPAAEVLFRRRLATTIGLPLADLVPRLADPEVRARGGIIEAEVRADLAGPGRVVPGIPVEATSARMEVGAEVWTNYVFRDIAARKAAEKQKDSFVASVSHELRTPLTSILGSLRLVTGGALGETPRAVKDLLGVAEKNGERLLTLLNDLLDAQKIAAGELNLELRPVSVAALLEHAIARHTGFAARFGVRLETRPVAADVLDQRLELDEERMVEVLGNLVSNAVKHSPEGGVVTVAVERRRGAESTADVIRFSVADRGPGIRPEAVGQLFDKFSRVAPADGRRRPGTGLGLAIAKELCAAHGGQIGVDSQVGLGSTFWIDLPLPKGAAE